MNDAERCAICGFVWTKPAQLAHTPGRQIVPCGCKAHQSPLENERLQHGAGRHHYRAWRGSDR